VQALRQVHKSVHSNREGKRDSVTLYVGNLEYNASEQDLREALDPVFQKIRVDKITIPRVNG
jgi:RNA recognition motif-containing protein